ncbi:EamA family transporter RarD [bacterium]|nr:EamA family transporter RarD [bacterium]
MSAREQGNLKTGVIYALLAYLAWGFFPIYWKFLKHVPSLEILCHRVVWAFAFYSLILAFKKKKFLIYWPENSSRTTSLLLAATLLMANWFVYIYAVNSNQIVESSLGYFINPLVNIAIGVFFLKEKLNFYQKLATFLAFIGVVTISVDQGHLPWIALFLAFSFSFYGLIKKLHPAPPLESNQYESLVMVPVAAGLLFFEQNLIGVNPFPLNTTFDISTACLLLGAGVITGLPLIFFAEAAQRMPFYLLGFFQFLAPSLQFMTGVFLFSEPLSHEKLIGFIFIWTAGALIILNNTVLNKIKMPKAKNL